MRGVHTDASTQLQSRKRASGPCLAPSGTAGPGSCICLSFTHLPPCLPSLGAGLLSALSTLPAPADGGWLSGPSASVGRSPRPWPYLSPLQCIGTMKALTPGGVHLALRVSPLPATQLPRVPSPTT